MSLFRNAAGVLATSMASMPIYFLTSIVLARALSVEDRGLYGVVIAFVGTAALLAEMGWGPATIYRIRRMGSNSGAVATAAIVATLLISSVVVLISLPFEDWIRARFLDNAPRWVLMAALAAVPFQLLWLSFASIARAIDRFAMQNIGLLALYMGRLVGMTVFLVLLGGALQEALLVYVAVLVATTLSLTVAVLRRTGLARFDLQELRSTWAFGLRAYASRLAAQLHERVDIFMIAYLLSDPRQVALYAIAVALLGQLRVMPEAVARALYPELAGTAEEGTGTLAARVTRHTTVFVVASVAVAAPLAALAIPLVYGEPYAGSVAPFLLLLPGMALFTRYRVLSNYFVSLGLMRTLLIIQVASVVTNVSLNWVLIPRYGISGAALASTISHGLAAIWSNWLFSRHAGISIAESLIPRRADLDPYRRRLAALLRRLRRGRPKAP